ncbi:MAG TPA: LuxR C-terminal-related transcriptional regulator [Smithella sp.]|nr:LuxR C-terminal-related transcriptional regulator [Smithella sp.]HOG90978.1 LuxR C-terminal-related transcriptional regulator [Smithella sp.]
MKKNHRKSEISEKEILYNFFQKCPYPIFITRAKDGTYIDVNENAVKFWGFKRQQIIGRTPTELGVYPIEKRNLLLKEIKENGFARNVMVQHQGLIVLFVIYPVKIGREMFLMSAATDVFNHQTFVKKFRGDKTIKLAVRDHEFIKAKLKQFQLTPRQKEIAILSTLGHSNTIIAKKLNISAYTVKDHVKEIFKILGIKSHRELFPKLLNIR